MIAVAAWAAHLAVYPVFTAYLWTVEPGARAFEAYLGSMVERLEALRDAELDNVEHARV